MIIFFSGCIVSYFVSRAVFGGKRTTANISASLIVACLSWIGLVFLVVSWLIYKLLTLQDETK